MLTYIFVSTASIYNFFWEYKFLIKLIIKNT
jgi:hypothetical protein